MTIRSFLRSALLVLAMALGSAFRSAADEPLPAKIRVLFIGNSYTHTFNIPVLIANLFAEKGVIFEHESDTPGGASLADHWTSVNTLPAIRRGGWDYVVLQDQSGRPLSDRSGVIASVAQFDAEIRKVGARTLVYQTWPQVNSYTGTFPNLSSSNGAFINETYRLAATGVGAILVPVGTGWQAAVNTIGQTTMHLSSSDSHPSQRGAYLSALTFFRTISRLGTTGLAITSGVSQTQANQAQAAVNGVTLAPTVAPTFNLAAGTYAGPQRILLNTVTPQATIHFTTDGTTPTTSSPSTASGGVVSISQTATLKAFAVGAGTSSSVTTAIFTITSTNGQTLFGSGSVSQTAVAWPGNPTNLAGSNAGFESGAVGPWGFYSSGGPVNGTMVRTGSFAAQLATGGMQRYVNGLAPNTLYEARVWYRYGTEVASTAFTAQSFSTPSVGVTGVMPNVGLPLAWRQVPRRFTTDATAQSVQLVCQRNSDTGAYDDLEFYKVPEGYELGLKFRSTTAGRITALRVFRPIGGPTAYTLRLWNGGGNVLDQVSVSSLSATGWIEVPLTAPRAITANTNYVASYGVAEGGLYQSSPNGLQTSTVNGALSSVLESNGVYALARGTSPAISTAANYWADVRFIPNTPLENWRAGHFTPAELSTPSLEATRWGHFANPDGDLFNNLLEYALERSPTVAEPPPSGLTATGLPLSLTFKRARADVTYTVQAGPNLALWMDLAVNPGSVGETVTVTSTKAHDRFIRLRVSQ